MKSKLFRLTALQSTLFYLIISLTTACFQHVPAPTPPDDDDRPRRPTDPRKYDDDRTGECAEDKDCREMCDDIFQSRKPKEECEEFSISAVEEMNEIFEVLEKPTLSDLESLNFGVLEMMIDISPKPVETTVSRMNPTEKKKFLVWLAEDSEAAKLISGADDDFKIMDELFGTTNTAIVSELKRSIDSGDTFVEIALEEENETAVEWLHEFFGNKCNSRDYEQCIFKDYYCGIYTSFSPSQHTDEKYFDYDFFIDALDEVLESHRPSSPPHWWDEGIDSDDLNDSWTDICRYL